MLKSKMTKMMMVLAMAGTLVSGPVSTYAAAVSDVPAVCAEVSTAKKASSKLTAKKGLARMKEKLGKSYLCDKKMSKADAISYFDLDKKKVTQAVYEMNSNSSLKMDTAVILKVKKGYAKTARKQLQKTLDQMLSYSKLYDMDSYRVHQARIYVKGNYVAMFIGGTEPDYKLSAQKQAAHAKSEAQKFDKAWKEVFGGSAKNYAEVD